MVFIWVMFLFVRAPPKRAYDLPPREGGEDDTEPPRGKIRRVFGA